MYSMCVYSKNMYSIWTSKTKVCILCVYTKKNYVFYMCVLKKYMYASSSWGCTSAVQKFESEFAVSFDQYACHGRHREHTFFFGKKTVYWESMILSQLTVVWFVTLAHCNTLQHAAAHCNTQQHTATHCNSWERVRVFR